MIALTTSLIIMAYVYIIAGISHFLIPKFFWSVTPPWVPKPKLVNILVGIIEICLGIGLFFSEIRMFALYGIILLLIAVFPANIYHFQKSRKKKQEFWITLARLPLQFLLIWWAYGFI
ncbi:MAG: DoxX family protein [Bacteroidota bacterium]